MAKPADAAFIKNTLIEINPRIRDHQFGGADNLFEINALDSYSLVQLVTVLEERLHFVFDFSDLNNENFSTLESIVKLLQEKYGCS